MSISLHKMTALSFPFIFYKKELFNFKLNDEEKIIKQNMLGSRVLNRLYVSSHNFRLDINTMHLHPKINNNFQHIKIILI